MSTEPPAPSTAAPTPPAPSLVDRAAPPAGSARALVLIDPRGAFASVKARPLAALTLALMLGLSLAPPIAFLASNDVAAVARRELKKSGRLDKLPEEQRLQAEELTIKSLPVVLPLGAAGKRAAWIFALAGLCFALLRGTRPGLAFAPLLSAVALASAPLVLHDAWSALTFALKDTSTLDAQNVVLSNPAAWLHMETGRSAAATLLRGLDFFALWACALVAIGANVVAGGRPSSLPWAVAFGLHFGVVALQAIGAAAAG
jgi:hypothetical protein